MPGGHSGSSHSSHSSSSHSSFSSSSRSSFSSSSSRSSHSTTSHSSTVTRPRTNRNTSTTPNVFENTQRGRRNQPQGYRYYDNRPPRVIRTYNHVYWYYPMGWNSGGRYYNRGFYDEDGVYYDSILAECPNCGTTVTLSLDQASDYFYCPNCGTQMDIVGSSTGVKRNTTRSSGSGFLKVLAGGFIAIMLLVSGVNLVRWISSRTQQQTTPTPETIIVDDWGSTEVETDNTAIFGQQLYLSRNGDGSYTISNKDSYDVIAEWSSYDEAYHDEKTDMWFWYNNYVEPGVWQYWYDDISYDFGDYGWMEYEDGIWWIERDYGDWIQVPSNYDTSVLWHIDY